MIRWPVWSETSSPAPDTDDKTESASPNGRAVSSSVAASESSVAASESPVAPSPAGVAGVAAEVVPSAALGER